MLNNVKLNSILKDVLYLSRLDKFLREKGLTIETATTEDFYQFIHKENEGKTDYYTQQPIPINFSAGLEEINDLVIKYRKVKVIIKSLLENEVL